MCFRKQSIHFLLAIVCASCPYEIWCAYNGKTPCKWWFWFHKCHTTEQWEQKYHKWINLSDAKILCIKLISNHYNRSAIRSLQSIYFSFFVFSVSVIRSVAYTQFRRQLLFAITISMFVFVRVRFVRLIFQSIIIIIVDMHRILHFAPAIAIAVRNGLLAF